VGEAGIERDEDRTLSPQGRKKTDKAVRGLAAIGCCPDRIFTSPLPRARETAERMAAVLDPSPPVEDTARLRPGADPESVLELLDAHPQADVMVVGHNPDLTELAAATLDPCRRVQIMLKKAGACSIEFSGRASVGAGSLAWLLQPSQLRGLARI
jgi:phosphohistidine phosphatase